MVKSNILKTLNLFILCILFMPLNNNAQKRKKKFKEPILKITDSVFHGLKWRNIGPYR